MGVLGLQRIVETVLALGFVGASFVVAQTNESGKPKKDLSHYSSLQPSLMRRQRSGHLEQLQQWLWVHRKSQRP